MSRFKTFQWSQLYLFGLLLIGMAFAPFVPADDSFHWDARQNRFTAEVGAWPLAKLLEKITESTGWEVYVEPATAFTASAKFHNLPLGEGLHALLGDLNFALVPQTNAPSRLYVFQTTMKAATQRIVSKTVKPRPEGAKPIPNELIVTVKPGVNIEELARKLGAKVVGRVDDLNTYRLQFDSAEAAQAALETLNANPDVVSVDYNFELPKPTPQSLSSGGGAADLPVHAKAIGADGVVTVGLVDTGGDPSAFCGGLSEFLLPSINVTSTSATPGSTPGHGLSMAATIVRGFAAVQGSSKGKAIRIQLVDVYGSNATTTTFDVANGIYRAVNSGANPINLSLGTTGDSAFLHRVIQNAAAQGVIFFAAAGNEHVTTATYPAAYPEVLAVTAGDRQGHIASYANYGSFVSAMAPGTSMVCYDGQAWKVQGTSAATAFASGLAAGAAALGANASQAATAVTSSLPVGTTGN